MIRRSSRPRANLERIIRDVGFNFHEIDGRPYWDERAYYEFTLAEIERIEAATNELHQMCRELVSRAVHSEEMMQRLGVPANLRDLAVASWVRDDQSLYGRFDFCYGGDVYASSPKMYEYNADTPTSLYESAVFQWQWLEDLKTRGDFSANVDQFTSIHDRLVERWGMIVPNRAITHFASMDNEEDEGTTSYVLDTARQAGVRCAPQMHVREIGSTGDGWFVDADGVAIRTLFKLYPWEWMAGDAYATDPAMRDTTFVEPAWKMLLSTKAILPLLWEMAPGHPNLLPAYFNADAQRPGYVRKPVHGREGANVSIVDEHGDLVESTAGPITAEPTIEQLRCDLPEFDGHRPVIGSWIVGDAACGIGIRESTGLITTNAACFVPHVIRS